MKTRNSTASTVVLFAVLILLLTGLTPGKVIAGNKGDNNTIRVALLPIPDTLPLHVAEEKGFFSESGIKVKVINVSSALERDQLMQSGQIDGMLNEMATTASFNRESVNVKIVHIARYPIGSSPLFRILSAPKSNIKNVNQLAGVPVAVSKNTVIEYVTDRILATRGLSEREIIKNSVPVIPERYQLLLSGQIKAANLPDPLAYSAMLRGAVEVTNDLKHPEFSISVLSFRKNAIDKKPETLRKFVAGWNRAAGLINKEPEKYRAVLLTKIRVPKNVHTSFEIPQFPVNEVPTERNWLDVIKWMKSKNLLRKEVPYSSSVTADFLK